MSQYAKDHFYTLGIRLCLMFIALVARVIYAYYLGVDILEPGAVQASFWFWTCVICGLVYFVALPRRRSPDHHPHQRSTDRRP